MKSKIYSLALVGNLLCGTTLAAAPNTAIFPDLDVAKKAAQSGQYNQASRHWRPLSDLGYTDATVNMGKMYARGQGVDESPEAAYEYFTKALEDNDPVAMAEIGQMHEKGQGVERNYNEALKWYKKSADEGYSRGNFMAGRLYKKEKVGRFLIKPMSDDTKIYVQSTISNFRANDFSNAENLGNIYSDGINIPAFPRIAYTYYRIAELNGSTTALPKMERLQGELNERDLRIASNQAERIFNKEEGAEKVLSYFETAPINKETPQEKSVRESEAVAYFQRAYAQGYDRAAIDLRELTGINPSSGILYAPEEDKKYRFVSSITTQFTAEENFDLGQRDTDLESAAVIDSRIGLYLHPTEDITTYIEVRGFASDGQASSNTDDDEDERDETFLEMRQAWINWDNLFGNPTLSGTFGRQRFREDRANWWNRDLDAVRLSLDSTITNGFIAVGQNLNNYRVGENDEFDEDEKDRFRVLGELERKIALTHNVSARFLYENDHSDVESIGSLIDADNRDSEDFDLTWVGFRSDGAIEEPKNAFKRITYSADIMGVFGEQTNISTVSGPSDARRQISAVDTQDVLGWAFDGQANFMLDTLFSPTLTIGYAYGSGDDDATDSDDNSFRQTDLHGNSSRYPDGVTSEQQRNYGEVLRPELSNIHVLNTGISIPVLKASDVHFLYYRYWLAEEGNGLRSSSISAPVNGSDNYLGQELDVSANIKVGQELGSSNDYLNNTTLRFRSGIFDAGDAYGTADDEYAARGTVSVRLRF